jgi:anaerobic ribonucleoside-triphosphate reductase activating protein
MNLNDDDPRKLLLNLCDVMVDGLFVEKLKDITLKFRGSSNQRIIDIHKSTPGNVVLHTL